MGQKMRPVCPNGTKDAPSLSLIQLQEVTALVVDADLLRNIGACRNAPRIVTFAAYYHVRIVMILKETCQERVFE